MKLWGTNFFIYENDIFFGQNDLKNFVKSGTPYCALLGRFVKSCADLDIVVQHFVILSNFHLYDSVI